MRDASDSPFLYEVGKGGWGDRGLRLKLAHRVSYRLIDLIVGELALSEDQTVSGFNEKPQAEGGFINGGFMVCSRELFFYLPDDPGMMLEAEPMQRLTADGKLGAYSHTGFWQPMDTFQEFNLLNRLWSEKRAPWKIW